MILSARWQVWLTRSAGYNYYHYYEGIFIVASIVFYSIFFVHKVN